MIVDDPRSNSASGGGSDYWLYGKVAQEWKISSLGPTVLFGEFFHGRHHGHIALDPLLSGGATEAGVSAETEMFGVGIMQSIEEADMQAYLAWRTYSVGGDAALGAGGAREALRLDDFQAIMAGSRINF